MTDKLIDTYEIPKEEIISNSQCGIEKLIQFREFLINLGINAQHSRIAKYIEFLGAINKDLNFDPTKIFTETHDDRFHSLQDWFVYTLREVAELFWIYRALSIRMPIGVEEKLKLINSGRDFAAFDTNSTSRDTQFELRIASYFCSKNLVIDVSTETDIIVEFEKFFLYIECKRIHSEKKLMRKIYEASDQLKSRMPKKRGGKPCYGLIAIDVTALAFPHQGLVFGVTSEHNRKIIQEKIIEIANNINSDNVMAQNPRLLAIWENIHIPATRMQPPGCETRFSYNMIFRNFESRNEIQHFLKIKHTIEESVDESVNENTVRKLTIRKTITLPKGISFEYNNSLLQQFFDNTEYVEKNWPELGPICTAEYNNEKIYFSVLEFRMALDEIEGKNERAKVDKFPGEIFLLMIIKRFPYNEIGPKWLASEKDGS